MKKIAIIGFGCAGYHAAREVRRLDPKAVIDVYSDTETAAYNPMLTTYYVKGAIPYQAMFPFGAPQEAAGRLGLNLFPNRAVTGLKPEERALCFGDGTQQVYDGILISTGASAVVPPLPGLDLPGVFKMRTVEDAVSFKAALDGGTIRRALVIGASWVGIKAVEDLVLRGIACTLADGAERVFSTAVFPETARRIERGLEARGVSVACGQMLDHVERAADGALAAVMQSGRRFEADAVAVCLGVRTNTGFLKDCGIAVNRGVLTDCHMQTNYEGIYAAGDCCEAADIQTNAPRNIGLWHNAARQGTVAGSNMAGDVREFGANLLVNLGHYLGYSFVSMGDLTACRPEDEVLISEDSRFYLCAVRGGRSAQMHQRDRDAGVQRSHQERFYQVHRKSWGGAGSPDRLLAAAAGVSCELYQLFRRETA